MDLFKLFGTIAIDGVREAKKDISGVTDTAQKSESKMSKAFTKIGEGLKRAFKNDEIDAFGVSLKDLTDNVTGQESKLDGLKKKYQDLYLTHGKNSEEAKDVAKEIQKLSTELQENKKKLKEAEQAANDFDATLEEASDGIEEVADTSEQSEGRMVEAFQKIGGAVVAAFAVDKIIDFGKAIVGLADSADSAMNDFAASTGTAKESLEEYEDVMKNIYKNNYGESFEDIADSMALVKQQMDFLEADGLETITTDALILRDTFDFEVSESVRAAKMLMDQFGIDGEYAFNLIAQGAQNGLDKNGDLLDSINEYSVHYAQLGFEAEDFFNSLANGTDAGTFSVDKLGDAMKEFGIRTKDGSDTSRAAFEALGYDADEMFQIFNEGGEDAAKATQGIINRLSEMEDGVDKTTAGVNLFGTMWEDLGAEGVKALGDIQGAMDMTKDTMSEINEVKYDSLGDALEGLKRKIETNLLVPLGDKLIPVVENVGNVFSDVIDKMMEGDFAGVQEIGIKLLQDFLDGFTQNIGSAVDKGTRVITSLVDGISSALPQLIPAAAGAVVALAMALVNAENIKSLIDSALALMEALADGILAALPVLTEAVPEVITSLLTALLGNENISKVIESGIEVNMALTEGLLSAIPELIAAMPEIIFAIGNTLMEYDWISLGKKMIEAYIKGITSMSGKLTNIIKSLLDANVKVYEGAYGKIDKLTGGALDKITGLWKNNLNLISDLATAGLNKIVDSFNSKIDRAKQIVESGLNLMKAMFNFEWKLPDIKMPHFHIDGEFSLNPPSVPKFSVKWNAEGAVLTNPTIFGMTGNTLLGGGEAGDEAVAPIDVLQGYVAEAVASQNAGLVAVLEKILLAIMEMDANMGGNLKDALEGMSFEWNKREVGRIVKAVT